MPEPAKQDFYDAAAIAEDWKKHFHALTEDLGIAFVADLCAVAEPTVRSWRSPKGKMPGTERLIYIHAQLSQIKDNRLTTNTGMVAKAYFRIIEVDEFRAPSGDGCIKAEAVDLLRVAGRIADAAMSEDADAGLQLMDVWDNLGKRLRSDFEAMKGGER
jgi:hypothetical protein